MSYPEPVARLVAFAAVIVAAIAAVGFLMLGGSYHPNAMLPILAICGGLCAAALERGYALFHEDGPSIPATSAAAAAILALGLGVFWLPFSLYPLTIVFAVLATAYGRLRYGSWVPNSLLIAAIAHLALAGWMLFGRFEFVSRADGAEPNAYFWPLMACSLALVSSLAIASAIQMRRHVFQVSA